MTNPNDRSAIGFGLSPCPASPPPGRGEPPGRRAPRACTRTTTSTASTRSATRLGARSVPAVAPDEGEAASEPARARRGAPTSEKASERGEAYWRREAERVRERLRAMSTRRTRCARASPNAGRRARACGSAVAALSSGAGRPGLEARTAALERRMRDLEETSPSGPGAPALCQAGSDSGEPVLCSGSMLEIPVELAAAPLRRLDRPRAAAPACPTCSRRSRRRRILVASRRVFALHGRPCRALAARPRPGPRRARAGRRAVQEPRDAGVPLRRASSRPAWVATASWWRSGGGVVGDLAGFAAATCMRGVDWVRHPDDAAVDGRQLDRRQGRASTTPRPRT